MLGVQVAVWTAAAPASPSPSAVPGGPEHSPEALAASVSTQPDVLLPDLPTRGGAQHLPENRRSPAPHPGRAKPQCPLGPISPFCGQPGIHPKDHLAAAVLAVMLWASLEAAVDDWRRSSLPGPRGRPLRPSLLAHQLCVPSHTHLSLQIQPPVSSADARGPASPRGGQLPPGPGTSRRLESLGGWPALESWLWS